MFESSSSPSSSSSSTIPETDALIRGIVRDAFQSASVIFVSPHLNHIANTEGRRSRKVGGIWDGVGGRGGRGGGRGGGLSILDLDSIMVLNDDGCVKAFDSPQGLLSDQNGTFYEMAKAANII